MDLRSTLVGRLAIAFALLILVFSLVWLRDLRNDALAEQVAASRLVDLLLAENGPDAPVHVAELLAGGDLRHVEAMLLPAGDSPPPTDARGWVARLGLSASKVHAHRIPVGDQSLLIRPDPQSEFQEQLAASIKVLVMLLVFCAASLVMTWFAVDRALSPVKELEAGLARMEEGAQAAPLPRFELREFAGIARVIDRLGASLNRARDNQSRLTRQLMDVQDKERRELAAELHDEFGQSLTAISASAAYIEHHAPTADPAVMTECAREIRNESKRVSGHVRQMLANLRPYGIDDSDIGETLSELVAGWRARLPDRRIETRIDAIPVLSATAGLALYRSLQEALTNCVRHSGASLVTVECVRDCGWIRLTVADNGRGTAQLLHDRAGGGLLGLRERLAMAGGSLSITDGVTGGVVLTARVPAASEEMP